MCVFMSQTLVLMSDLATVLDLQGKHDEALAHVKKAVELGQAAGHPEQHILLGNMAGILMHKGSRRFSSHFFSLLCPTVRRHLQTPVFTNQEY